MLGRRSGGNTRLRMSGSRFHLYVRHTSHRNTPPLLSYSLRRFRNMRTFSYTIRYITSIVIYLLKMDRETSLHNLYSQIKTISLFELGNQLLRLISDNFF